MLFALCSLLFVASCTDNQLGSENPTKSPATAQKTPVKNELTAKIDEMLPSISAAYQQAKKAGTTNESFEEFLQKQLNAKITQPVKIHKMENVSVKQYTPELRTLPNNPQIQNGIYKQTYGIDGSVTRSYMGGQYYNYLYMRLAVLALINGSWVVWSYDVVDPYSTEWYVVINYYEIDRWGYLNMYATTYSGVGLTYGLTFTSTNPIAVTMIANGNWTKYFGFFD
ncbi:MAG: hypothetical protein MUF71_15110 [Candidatus Kapabacteria bacterium]|nr:hypothetical protein [Candidatus Kapabacteria bacterium]